MLDRFDEMRMRVTRRTGKLQEDFQMPTHQQLRLGKAVL
jgi:hypothetical protein